MIIDGVEIKDGDPILLWDHPIPIYGIYVMSKKKTYNHHLACYFGNLSWRHKKLKFKLISYLQRSVHGSSPMVTTKKVLNKWREAMAEQYKEPESDREYDNIWISPENYSKPITKYLNKWMEDIKKLETIPSYGVNIVGSGVDSHSMVVEITAPPGTHLFEKFKEMQNEDDNL